MERGLFRTITSPFTPEITSFVTDYKEYLSYCSIHMGQKLASGPPSHSLCIVAYISYSGILHGPSFAV